MKTAWIVLVVAVSAAALPVAPASGGRFEPETVAPDTIRLGTGSPGGIYNSLGVGIKEAVEEALPGVTVVVRHTDGSIDNARLLDNGSLDLGLMQSDIAAYFSRGERMFCFPSSRIMGLVSLYTEALHVVARRDLDIGEIRDLRGRKVAVGPAGSGSEFIARFVLEDAGMAYADLGSAEYLAFDEASRKLLSGEIDAAFMTSGVPAPAIVALDSLIAFVPLGGESLKRVQAQLRELRFTRIPGSAYPSLLSDDSIRAIGPRALLVATDSMPVERARKITAAIFDGKAALEAAHPAAHDIRLEYGLFGMSVRPHVGATEFYEGRPGIDAHIATYLIWALIAIALVAAGVFIWWTRPRQLRRPLQNRFVISVLVLGVVFCIVPVVIHVLEWQENDDFMTLGRAFWSTTRYVISGMGSREPVTKAGRANAAILLFMVRFGVMGTVVGGMATLLMGGKMKLPGGTSGHVVICGWSDKTERIIRELRDPRAGRGRVIVVISDQVSQEVQDDVRRRHTDVHFVSGDPADRDVLKSARVSRARSVIILADSTRESPDDRTTVVAMAIDKWCEETHAKGDGPCIVAEAVTPQGKSCIRSTGVGQVVCPTDYGLGLLAQCAIHQRVSIVYDELLKWSDDTNEIYEIRWEDIPDVLRHRPFEEAATILSGNRDPENPVVLLGVIHEGEVILNPRSKGALWKKVTQGFQTIEKGDALIVMAFREPNLKKQLNKAASDRSPSDDPRSVVVD